MILNFLKEFFEKINKKISINNTIVNNIISLGFLELIRVLVPIIAIPILISKLGIEKYGLIIFAEAMVLYFTFALNFGFDLSATKEISKFSNNLNKISEIVSSVIIIKLLIFIIAIFIYFFIFVIFNFYEQENVLFFLSFLIVFQSIIIPIWFFQGLQKMQYLTIVDSISRVSYLIFILFFINTSEDYLLVPIFKFFGLIISSFFSFYFLFIKEKIRFYIVDFKLLVYHFKLGAPFFISNFSNLINSRTNNILLGLYASFSILAYYDFVYKIIQGLTLTYGTIIKVMYPHIALSHDKIKARLVTYFNIVISILCYFMICYLSNKIIFYGFGSTTVDTFYLFYLLGLLLPLNAIEWSLGTLHLAAFNYDKIYSLSSIYSTVVYFIIIIYLFLINNKNLNSLILAILIRFAFLGIYRLYFCKKLRLI